MLKSNKYFIWIFIDILFGLEKYAFVKIALAAQINVHFVRNNFRGPRKFISAFLDFV